ncbi:MAG: hypothetical protein PHR64_03235 [Candidatus Shapirobacteria bacterium]|nr:hypothetical protein [Candidatus Shapirobacteria bacterium]MDD5073822.1 hypothetical protein [Candidatus Shapirobacteria bacterium]MDD5481923.1 hypothetical protein [Candidatus Shapirobacteria bacterium]
MSQLTQTAHYARKFIKFSLIGLLAIIILVPISRSFRAYWEERHPKPPPPPNLALGKIPPLKLGTERYPVKNFSFQLQTIDGNLPNLGTQSRVYFVPILGPKFFDEDKTRRTAAALGFSNELGKISNTRFAFSNTDTGATIKIDTINNNFEISYPWEDNPFFANIQGPSQNQALQAVQNFLNQAGLWPEDIDPKKTNYIFLKYSRDKRELVSIPSLSESHLIKVNLRRADLDDQPVMAPNPDEANISFIVSSLSGNRQFIFAKYIRYPISYDRFGTYPIKSSVTAWEELGSGQGFVARLGDNNDQGTITIRNIYLAYFDPEVPQSFLQPIFVFEGLNNFLAYLPALDPSVVSQESQVN